MVKIEFAVFGRGKLTDSICGIKQYVLQPKLLSITFQIRKIHLIYLDYAKAFDKVDHYF